MRLVLYLLLIIAWLPARAQLSADVLFGFGSSTLSITPIHSSFISSGNLAYDPGLCYSIGGAANYEVVEGLLSLSAGGNFTQRGFLRRFSFFTDGLMTNSYETIALKEETYWLEAPAFIELKFFPSLSLIVGMNNALNVKMSAGSILDQTDRQFEGIPRHDYGMLIGLSVNVRDILLRATYYRGTQSGVDYIYDESHSYIISNQSLFFTVGYRLFSNNRSTTKE